MHKRDNMEALIRQENQHNTEVTKPASNNETVRRNPGLRALLAIRNFSIALEKDFAELLQIEADLEATNNEGLLLIETHGAPGSGEQWKLHLAEVTKSIEGLNQVLTTAKERISLKEKEGLSDLWNQLGLLIQQLTEAAKKLKSSGYVLLPETVYTQWDNEFLHFEQPLVDLVISHVESCRVLMQMTERYTPDELNAITKIIVDQIPPDFTYEEAVVYRRDYFKALVNFKKEFKAQKNLWDKFLDILAGGTHQPPSERVMLERWIEGEKGELE